MSNEYVHFNNNTQPAINEGNLNLMQQLIKQDITGAVSGDTLPIGAILPYPKATAPANWLICDGSAVSRTTYSDLFNVIGTTYGAGDGSTTFNLPDLRGKVPVGYDVNQTEFQLMGTTGGEKTVTLNKSNLPAGTVVNEIGGIHIGAESGTVLSKTTAATAINNLQPYQTVNYIIKAFQTAGVVAEVVNEHSESVTNVYSCNYINSNFIKVFPVSFSTGAIEANADLYDKTKSITTSEISSDYTPIGIVGQTLVGAYYSHCPFTRLYVGGTNNRTLYWSIKNTFNAAITTLSATVYVLAIKTSI